MITSSDIRPFHEALGLPTDEKHLEETSFKLQEESDRRAEEHFEALGFEWRLKNRAPMDRPSIPKDVYFQLLQRADRQADEEILEEHYLAEIRELRMARIDAGEDPNKYPLK